MKKLWLLVGILSAVAGARPLTTVEKRQDLETLATIIKAKYGPYEYKIQQLKLDPEQKLKEYIAESESLDNVGFYYLINRFIAEFKDSHFSATVKSERVARLGFIVDRIDGKVLVDEIDKAVLPEKDFPFERGDELVAFDGKPIAEVLESLSHFKGMGNPQSLLRTAAIGTTYRPGSMGPLPSGKAKVSLRHGTSNIIDTVEIPWLFEGKEHPSRRTRRLVDYSMISSEDVFEGLPNTEKGFRCSGKTRIQVPADAVKIIETPFVAYYHPTPKGNIGYLRIPHYNWKNATTGATENDFRFRQYKYAISELEAHTVGLVIDQDHNCGGSVDLVEEMVGLFADKPYVGLQFQFMASRSEYIQFSKWIKETPSDHTFEELDLTKVMDLIKTTWEKGVERLTAKSTFAANRLLIPNSVHYSKPVLVLIDEMSGSGGDAFPAMLQGLGRAKLFGQRTMGAGGHVEEMPDLPYSGNSFRMTRSLFYHPNGTAIENNGASPDIEYQTTRDDFLYGYRDYQKKYLEALSALIP